MSAVAVSNPPEAALNATEGVVHLAAPFVLEEGGGLAEARMGWRMVGPDDAPVVLAIGGISGHRRVADPDGGWWKPVAGPGRALDTDRYRVLGIDYLGGSGVSTAPVAGERFPTISAYDQAAAIAEVVRALGLAPLRAVIGASYGAQVALALGARHAQVATRLLVLSAADRVHPLASGWRALERDIVRFGIATGRATDGLKLARALAMTTYRTAREFEQKFTGAATREATTGIMRTPIEGYLHNRGDAYVATYKPESFVALSESIDVFRIDARDVVLPVTAVAVPEDQLVPYAHMQGLVERLPQGRLVTLESLYGHDAFLKEGEALKAIFAECLEGARHD
jgi:homoserine O-acetyltransferase